MKSFLDRFVLGIPRLYIKQFPYAWIFFIALWTWPPNLAFIFLLIILVGAVDGAMATFCMGINHAE